MWEIFHKLRMDYDTYFAVAAPLRLVCLVSLETPDVGDIPQTVLETLGAEARFEIMRAWKPDFEIVRMCKSDLKHVGTKA
ncbi:hypothetical protein Taro_021219 [Colocasia esculenta]|uniref:Uncharacterized protein n=1 Tax=Colocasia esculenta TaxID=4460 RepID=A0A843V4Q7_COLES|nr:hypothetical protein [Colocasia esculenta]